MIADFHSHCCSDVRNGRVSRYSFPDDLGFCKGERPSRFSAYWSSKSPGKDMPIVSDTQAKVSRTMLPLWSIGLTTLINLLLALLNIGSDAAFSAFTSMIIVGFYSSFIVVAGVILHKRMKGPDSAIQWGPFKLGRAGIFINLFAIVYSILGIFFVVWPPSAQVSASTMNWSIIIYGTVLMFSLLFWLLHGLKVYTGPLIEIDNNQATAG